MSSIHSCQTSKYTFYNLSGPTTGSEVFSALSAENGNIYQVQKTSVWIMETSAYKRFQALCL